jgi:transcriptional regulator with XRE-family HTH domain
METRIRETRAQRGWTVRRLAEESGVDKNTVSDVERGARNPNPITMHKLAEALGVEVVELFPKAQEAPRPLEQPPTASPEVREWLMGQGAKFAVMSDAEFSELVLNMEAGTQENDLLEGIERLVEKITEEDLSVERALMREFAQGGNLFPTTPDGPDVVKRAFARHKGVMRLRRALADRYQVFRRSLTNYSMRLYEAGRTSDFLVHPRLAEIMRRQLLEEAFAEEGAA